MEPLIFDVFGSENEQGNPCAVVLLEQWLSDAELQQIATQIAQPVTSFVVTDTNKHSRARFEIRWFTMHAEINLCGHGSLGAGAALLLNGADSPVTLNSNFGVVTIEQDKQRYRIDMPCWQKQPRLPPSQLAEHGITVIDCFTTRDFILVLDSAQAVSEFPAEFATWPIFDEYHALIVTSALDSNGYALRYFAPKIGIAEDIATGSAHCSLGPYWFAKLNQTALYAQQLSQTGGAFSIEYKDKERLTVGAEVQLRH